MGDEMANEWLAGGEGGRLWHRRLMKSGAFVFLRRNFRVSFKQFLIHFCASNRHTGLEPVAKKRKEDQKFSTQHLQWLYPIHYFTHSTTLTITPQSLHPLLVGRPLVSSSHAESLCFMIICRTLRMFLRHSFVLGGEWWCSATACHACPAACPSHSIVFCSRYDLIKALKSNVRFPSEVEKIEEQSAEKGDTLWTTRRG